MKHDIARDFIAESLRQNAGKYNFFALEEFVKQHYPEEAAKIDGTHTDTRDKRLKNNALKIAALESLKKDLQGNIDYLKVQIAEEQANVSNAETKDATDEPALEVVYFEEQEEAPAEDIENDSPLVDDPVPDLEAEIPDSQNIDDMAA